MAQADSPLVALLRRHGLSRAAARTVERVGRELRSATRRRGIEYAVLLDSETGVETGPRLSGQTHSVDIREQIRVAVPGRRYVQFHTHPHSTAFSDSDALVLVGHEELVAMVVLGPNDVWYALSKDPENSPSATRQAAEQVFGAFWDTLDALQSDFDALVSRGEMTEEDARRALTHTVWQRIAVAQGLRYDRLEPQERSDRP